MDLNRYQRQWRFAPLGEAGQRRLASARALVCGCGALGSVSANVLVRAGVGFVRLVDRDFLEISNLQRQVIYTEADVREGLPKAIAAANHLRSVNSDVHIEPVVSDLTWENIDSLAADVDVIVDGTDNFQTRFLLNDFSINKNVPWVFGGCVGAEGQTMTIVPEVTRCLRCLLPEAPPPSATESCDTAGILAPIIGLIASAQSCEAIKILSGHVDAIRRRLLVVDLWDNQTRMVGLDALDPANCPTCTRREFPWLNGHRGTLSAVLCGRNAVQLNFPGEQKPDLDELARKLAALGPLTRNPFLLRLQIAPYTLTIFPDGRTIVAGTDDIVEARSLHARYIGS
ncbi:MAG: thiazole biosynthesis adenylyltransferase ThiF [Planctomycetes bacterium]|nr:thiazole biosynthesis adenylyltransferase ThiF [Planctomycetota bacterium]